MFPRSQCDVRTPISLPLSHCGPPLACTAQCQRQTQELGELRVQYCAREVHDRECLLGNCWAIRSWWRTMSNAPAFMASAPSVLFLLVRLFFRPYHALTTTREWVPPPPALPTDLCSLGMSRSGSFGIVGSCASLHNINIHSCKGDFAADSGHLFQPRRIPHVFRSNS